MLSKIHTSSTNNFCLELYKPYGTCTVLWLHIIIELVQLHVISRNFLKWYTLKIFFFSQIHACLCKVTRGIVVFFIVIYDGSCNSKVWIHVLSYILYVPYLYYEMLYLRHFSLFFHIFILVQPFSQLIKIWMP